MQGSFALGLVQLPPSPPPPLSVVSISYRQVVLHLKM